MRTHELKLFLLTSITVSFIGNYISRDEHQIDAAVGFFWLGVAAVGGLFLITAGNEMRDRCRLPDAPQNRSEITRGSSRAIMATSAATLTSVAPLLYPCEPSLYQKLYIAYRVCLGLCVAATSLNIGSIMRDRGQPIEAEPGILPFLENDNQQNGLIAAQLPANPHQPINGLQPLILLHHVNAAPQVAQHEDEMGNANIR